MSKKTLSILAITEGIIIVVLFLLVWQGQPLKETLPTGQGPIQQNILDGIIKDIDYQNTDSFVMHVITNSIAGASKNPMEKRVRLLSEVTEWTEFDQSKGKETPTKFTEAKKGNYILVYVVEDPESINDIEEFTALKVTIFKR